MTIHFICRGNVLRSLIAETYLKSLSRKGLDVISSGTNPDWQNPQQKEYFTNTLKILDRHNIKHYAKDAPDQLTQQRIDSHSDVVICMNQRIFNEASQSVKLPHETIVWDITDIGEGERTDVAHRELYEEDIYQEIVDRVEELAESINSKKFTKIGY